MRHYEQTIKLLNNTMMIQEVLVTANTIIRIAYDKNNFQNLEVDKLMSILNSNILSIPM